MLGTLILPFRVTRQKVAFSIDSSKKEIEAWNVKFGAIVKNIDSVGFANLYSLNTVQINPNAPQIEERINI